MGSAKIWETSPSLKTLNLVDRGNFGNFANPTGTLWPHIDLKTSTFARGVDFQFAKSQRRVTCKSRDHG